MSAETLVIIFLALAVEPLVKCISGLGLPLTAIPAIAGYMEVDRAAAIMFCQACSLTFGCSGTIASLTFELQTCQR